MRFLIISVLLLCAFSCALPLTKGLTVEPSKNTQITNPYFSNPTIDYLYKAKIEAFGNYFGGILIIKKIKQNHHRVVFTSDFGNTLFDFEIEKNNVKLHSILEELDKSVIISTLQNDFKTLTKEHNAVESIFRNQETLLYKSKLGKRYNYYIKAAESDDLKQIVHTTKRKTKIIFTFSKITKDFAETIVIEHKSQPVTINLSKLDTP